MYINFSFFIINLVILLVFASCNSNVQEKNNSSDKKKKLEYQHTPQNVEFLIENSASNFGYIEINSIFKKILSKFITDLRSKDFSNELAIGYVNGERYCKGSPFKAGIQIKNYIENLTPKFLQSVNCPTNSSDMVNVIMNSMPDTSFPIKIVFSDFIFSLKDNHSIDHLSYQRDFLKETLSKYLKSNQNLGILVIKFLSEFKGTYYCEIQNKMIPNIEGKRPFYIFIIGNYQQITYLTKQISFKDYEGFQNMMFFYPIQNKEKPNAKLAINVKEGEIELEGLPKNLTFKNNRYEGKLEFQLFVDLSNYYLPKEILEDISLYELSNGFELKKIETIDEEQKNESNKNYTHVLTIHHANYKPKIENLLISYHLKVPKWVEESHSEDDSQPVSEEQSKKTFGFKYLMQGIYEAFTNQKGSKLYQLEIKFKD